jgi:hypothetical protein
MGHIIAHRTQVTGYSNPLGRSKNYLLLKLGVAVRACLHGLRPLRLAVFEHELHLLVASFMKDARKHT